MSLVGERTMMDRLKARRLVWSVSTALAAIIVPAVGVPLAKAENISFTRQVKPILDTKCVSCHACYDSPAQLDLRSPAGIARGAKKIDVYGLRLFDTTPTFVWDSPKKLEDWRKEGFFSVTEGGKNSIMGKMLRHGYQNPLKANQRVPEGVQLDPFLRQYTFPNRYEIDGYIAQKPHEGMPLAVAGLTPKEYATLMQWLGEGAKFDNKPAQPSSADLALIGAWEGFLNGSDTRTKLMARYIYEHLFLVSFRFENTADAKLYTLVRSTTPPGKPVVPVKQHVPNRPVEEGEFFYRFLILDQTPCVKVIRNQLFASQKKLDRTKQIFEEQKWDATALPGYTEEERFNPLSIFAAIPAKVRYKFDLDNVWNIRAAIAQGPSCHGNLAVSVSWDVSWEIYENPETSLYVNDPEYRAMVDKYMSFYVDVDNLEDMILSNMKFIERRKEFIKAWAQSGKQTRMTDIWRGEDDDDSPIDFFIRHDTDAYVATPNELPGDYPRNGQFHDLPILELQYYSGTANYDQFAAAYKWLVNREQNGMARIASELNLLRMIPRKDRVATFRSWYQSPLSDIARAKLNLPEIDPEETAETAIEYTTDDPMKEFWKKVVEYMGDRVKSKDPINRADAPVPTEPVAAAMRRITDASKQAGPAWRKFKALIPEVSFLRIERKGQDPLVYTMTRDRWYANKAFISTILQKEDPSKTQVSILEGVLASYPRFVFSIPESEVGAFADTLIAAENEEALRKAVERWGIRRSSPNFWGVLESIKDYVRRKDPTYAGVFDVSMYLNL